MSDRVLLKICKDEARQLAARKAAEPPAPVSSPDLSVLGILVTNLAVLAFAAYQKWGLSMLMLIYFGQSLVIGIFQLARILSLDKFSTEKFTLQGQPVEPTPQTQRSVAWHFACSYFLFHVVLLVCLAMLFPTALDFDRWFWLGTLAFAVSHLWSYRNQRDIDRRDPPNIGALALKPIMRIWPMHLVILVGGLAGPGRACCCSACSRRSPTSACIWWRTGSWA